MIGSPHTAHHRHAHTLATGVLAQTASARAVSRKCRSIIHEIDEAGSARLCAQLIRRSQKYPPLMRPMTRGKLLSP